MSNALVSEEQITKHGLTLDEYERIRGILARDPNLTELGIFSVMWSEHCSYKSSKVHLKRLPTRGPCVVQGPGENAGVVEIGDGLVAIFKMESHNHPSYIEPYQGAATGAGGIIRDIFTMGARPIALMDGLHFGFPDDLKNRHIVEGVVAGIAGYGNCIGIPTVGGQTVFSRHYGSNPLVNVFCLGIARSDQVFYGRATGVGNPVIYVGAATGRDGIHGATMASEEFDEKSQEKRPTVQVGDPFMEKLLLEACLEAMRAGYVIGIQDMGAAGLTCSTCEMGSRGGAGIEIELDRVPQRETGMSAYEIMLSESQERMLLVARPEHEEKIREVFERWGLHASTVGTVLEQPVMRVLHGGMVVADIPNVPLADGGPVYNRPMERPAYLDRARILDEAAIPAPADWGEALHALMTAPNMCRKQWIWEQYDHMVRTNTVQGPGGDAAVLRLKGTGRLLAMSIDCNPRFCYLDPEEGARQAVAESCRNIVCIGGTPLAATNCLNFASPENPEIMWQFARAVDGIAAACEAFGTPITGGNVSFYNETSGTGVFPTPVIGMVGLVDGEERVTSAGFGEPGDALYLAGSDRVGFGGTEYLELFHAQVCGQPVPIDLEFEKGLQAFLSVAIAAGKIRSAHDCAEGGLLACAVESAFLRCTPCGFDLQFDGRAPAHLGLFGEGPSRILLSVGAAHSEWLEGEALRSGIPLRQVGAVTQSGIRVRYNGLDLLESDGERLWKSWSGALEARLHSD